MMVLAQLIGFVMLKMAKLVFSVSSGLLVGEEDPPECMK